MNPAMQFVYWLGAFAEDGNSGKPSCKRVITLMAGTALSAGALALLLAKAWYVYEHGGDVAAELFAVVAPLCALAGVNYTVGKPADRAIAKEPQ